jgi:ABC-type glycerol-3-phosphate transport system substrate-binding protein
VGYAALPAGEVEGTTGAWSWALSMSKKSANKGAAWLFIQWVTGTDTSAGLGALTGGAPRTSAASDPEYLGSFDEEYITTTAALIADARNLAVMRLNWKDGAYIIVDAMLEIAQGADPDETLAAANTKLGSAFS